VTPSLVLPRYGESTLAELLPAAVAAISRDAGGGPAEPSALGLPAARVVVVLLVDGLGAALLARHREAAPFLHELDTGRRLTSGVPSTTVTSLTSLGTGLPPGRHGLVGYTHRVDGGDRLLNGLRWDTDVDPTTYQPYPTVFESAAAAGVAVSVVGKGEFRSSGLTRAGLRSPGYRPASSWGQRLAAVADACAAPGPALVYVYESDLDYTGHVNGCESDAWRLHLTVLDRVVEELAAVLPPDAVLIVTGDHGMVDVAEADRVDVEDVPALLAGVALVGGEARFRHVYTHPDADPVAVAGRWRDVLGDRATVVTRADAVAAGWFGPVEARVAQRIGDVLVACTGPLAVEHRRLFPMEARLRGLHGSLTEDEMAVPLLVHAGRWTG
jgi:hypothetical protein